MPKPVDAMLRTVVLTRTRTVRIVAPASVSEEDLFRLLERGEGDRLLEEGSGLDVRVAVGAPLTAAEARALNGQEYRVTDSGKRILREEVRWLGEG